MGEMIYLLPAGITYLDIPIGGEFDVLYPPVSNAILEYQRSPYIVRFQVVMKQFPKVDKELSRYYVQKSIRAVTAAEVIAIMEGVAA